MLTSDSDAPSRPPRRKRQINSTASRRSIRSDDPAKRAASGGVGDSLNRRKNMRSVKRAGTVRRQANGAPSVGTGSLSEYIYILHYITYSFKISIHLTQVVYL